MSSIISLRKLPESPAKIHIYFYQSARPTQRRKCVKEDCDGDVFEKARKGFSEDAVYVFCTKCDLE